MENAIKKESHCLGHMQYEHHNGVLVQKRTKAKGGSQFRQAPTKKQAPQQEEPSYLEDFDYENP